MDLRQAIEKARNLEIEGYRDSRNPREIESFENSLISAIESYCGMRDAINTLTTSHYEGKTIDSVLERYAEVMDYWRGHILGQLKARVDTLPERVAMTWYGDGIPMDIAVKVHLDRAVREKRESNSANDLTGSKEYWSRYRRLLELICGYGYSLKFSEERFRLYFPAGTHQVVLGFAEGYSSAFHAIAKANGISATATGPKTQDIWRNWPYFTQPDVLDYRLDGRWIFPYCGGGICSVPIGDNQVVINGGVYEDIRRHGC